MTEEAQLADWRAALLDGAERMALPMESHQVEQLLGYLALLGKWNKVYNLTAIDAPAEMLRLHLLDSLGLVAALAREDVVNRPMLASSALSVLDVGSGGGLPGVVLAIMRPDFVVTCVDKVGKKARFIQQVAAELRLPRLIATHERVEAVRGQFDLITSRAFSSLPDLIEWTRHLAVAGTSWVAMKGRMPHNEIECLPPDVMFHVEHLNVPGVDAERCLVWMSLRAA